MSTPSMITMTMTPRGRNHYQKQRQPTGTGESAVSTAAKYAFSNIEGWRLKHRTGGRAWKPHEYRSVHVSSRAVACER